MYRVGLAIADTDSTLFVWWATGHRGSNVVSSPVM
jgi:hypothetical protein